ncbi:MAG: hypothetical protein K2Q18_16485 [Bdellovibrionales bacterium]|nr:hypothetical protein [Bdellovibrionales bacterium]
MDKKISHLRNDKGQALFELIIFLPFLIFLYMLYGTVGNSISASINQQKAVRGYFYSLVRGNSYVNSLNDLNEYTASNLRSVGFMSLGWREKSDGSGKIAFAPCFAFSSLMKNGSTEECDDADRDEDSDGSKISRYIRVFTFYGVCGPVYSEEKEVLSGDSHYLIHPSAQSDPFKCSLGNEPVL